MTGPEKGADLERSAGRAETLLEDLSGRGLDAVEVFCKVGRLKRWELDAVRGNPVATESAPGANATFALLSHTAAEEGWAVRAGDHRGSTFVCGGGAPPLPGSLPIETAGTPLRLPELGDLGPSGSTSGAPAYAQPLGEAEAFGLLRAVAQRVVDGEVEGVRFLTARVDDGASSSFLTSSKGVRTASSHRSAWLRVSIACQGADGHWCPVELEEVSREPRRWRAESLANRLLDLARLAAAPALETAFRGPATLAPSVAAAVLGLLLPAFCEGRRGSTWRRLLSWSGDGGLASEVTNITDDGRFVGGLFEAAADGEGVPTRRVAMVERGVLRQPLLPWWCAPEEVRDGSVVSGCRLRHSWRTQPEIGASHLYLAPSARAPAELIEGMGEGAYLLTCEGLALDWSSGQVSGLVSGFELRAQEPPIPFRRARLAMPLTDLLRGIEAIARDLTFPATPGTVGAPTTRVAAIALLPE